MKKILFAAFILVSCVENGWGAKQNKIAKKETANHQYKNSKAKDQRRSAQQQQQRQQPQQQGKNAPVVVQPQPVVVQPQPTFLHRHAWLTGATGLVIAQWTAYVLYRHYQNKNKTPDIEQPTTDFSQLTAEELIEEMSALENDSGFLSWIKNSANLKMLLVSAGLLGAGALLDSYCPESPASAKTK